MGFDILEGRLCGSSQVVDSQWCDQPSMVTIDGGSYAIPKGAQWVTVEESSNKFFQQDVSNFKKFQDSESLDASLNMAQGVSIPEVAGVKTSYGFGVKASSFFEMSNSGRNFLTTAAGEVKRFHASFPLHAKVTQEFAQAAEALYAKLKDVDQAIFHANSAAGIVLRLLRTGSAIEAVNQGRLDLADFFKKWGQGVVHSCDLGGKIKQTYQLDSYTIGQLKKHGISPHMAASASFNAKVPLAEAGIPATADVEASREGNLASTMEKMRETKLELKSVQALSYQKGGVLQDIDPEKRSFASYAASLKPDNYGCIHANLWPIYSYFTAQDWPYESKYKMESMRLFFKKAWEWNLALGGMPRDKIEEWKSTVLASDFEGKRKGCNCKASAIVRSAEYTGANFGPEINFVLEFCPEGAPETNGRCSGGYGGSMTWDHTKDGTWGNEEKKVFNKKIDLGIVGKCGDQVYIKATGTFLEADWLFDDVSKMTQENMLLASCGTGKVTAAIDIVNHSLFSEAHIIFSVEIESKEDYGDGIIAMTTDDRSMTAVA
eukprot:TRINITY_DN37150_c0_g1_i1.p1 TRINITY_DN37150_c0_g1~~TRINITY_DN37150_c0_g1_i1.p1  ORF type:complete len:598 (-),score=141.29 TRINITY_DN37150_c0_g1_i1:78-1715(-)